MFDEAVNYIRERGMIEAEYGLILGSGLGDLADEVENKLEIDYEDIPNFPVSTVEGHEGKLIYGDLSGRKVIVLKGRFHFYEGYDLQTVTYPVRIFKELGVKRLILTNAAGGVNENFQPGQLMVITDHINLTGSNPLMGQNLSQHGPRFVDMTETYSTTAQKLLLSLGDQLNIPLQEGVYTWFTGPTYETPAEVRMARILGGDAVGMSTVPEAIVAKHAGIEVIGISCITNLGAGMQSELNHQEVVEVSQQVKPHFKALIKAFIREY